MLIFHSQIDVRLFLSVFGLIFLAELPDKTAFATLLMATRRRALPVFCGAAAAFLVQSLIAVAFGNVFGMLPHWIVKIGTGFLFLGFSAALWFRKVDHPGELRAEETHQPPFIRALWTSFVVVFIAEWGDLTQLATATLSAKHRQPVTVFLAATAALWTVTALAVAAGHRAKANFHPQVLQKIAALAFAVAGVLILIR